MSAVLNKTHYNAEDYLQIERSAPYKSEFCDGQIFAMTGASRKHNLVCINIGSALHGQLKNRPCEAYLANMRVKAASAHSYHYPDISVVCGKPEFEDDHFDTLLNPTLLIEVLSPSTAHYDRSGKFANYRKIAALQEYLLVAQDLAHIEHYTRQETGWLLTEAEGLDAVMMLDSIGCFLNLSDVYDKVLNDVANEIRGETRPHHTK